jgi:hypothetical protein
MDLEYSDKHKTLQQEVGRFIAEHGQQSPKTGGGRKRPDHQVLEWQRLLLMLWTAPATGITMCQSAVAVNRQEGAVL